MEALLNIIQAWWQWTTAVSLQLALLVALVIAIDALLARWTWPQVRAALWFVVLIKLVVPPTLSSPTSIAHVTGRIPHFERLVEKTNGQTWPALLFVIWISGIALCSVIAIRRYHRARGEWLANTESGIDARLHTIATSAASRIGLRNTPTLLISGVQAGPAVIGFLRSVVVLPRRIAEERNTRRIEHVLLHEFAHIRRCDPLMRLLVLALQIIYWFHPLVWLAGKRLATLREMCCDQTVAEILRDNTVEYRRTLLELAHDLVDRPTHASLSLIHPQSQLLARLKWLEKPRVGWRKLRRTTTVAAFAIVSACGLPMELPSIPPPFEPIVDQDPGCMRLRLAVLQAIAQEAGYQRPAEPGPPI